MATVNKYDSMSALDALKKAKNRSMLLPDIQREYVWSFEDIEYLFESIVDDYPIGACIFWKTNRKTINEEKPNLYYFIRKFEKYKTKNEKAPEVFSEEAEYYVVLDGQQRITSLNIALYGSYSYYKGGRGKVFNSPKYWLEKELYYNLDFYVGKDKAEKDDTADDDEEYPKKRFCFLTKEEAAEGNYYKIKSLLAYDDLDDYIASLADLTAEKRCRKDLSKLFQRLNDSSDQGLIHYYCISADKYDKALNIFVRVNSTGRKLSKSDLLFSTLIDGWQTGKEDIETLLATMNSTGDGFKFSRDYLMRLSLVLIDANTNLKITSLTQKTVNDIRGNWPRKKASLETLAVKLADAGICDENLTSYNATMPIAYYLYKGGTISGDTGKKEVRKFLSVSMAKALFGVASNSALDSTRKALLKIDCKKTPFALSLFAGTTLTGGRTFEVPESEIDSWLDTFEIGISTYVILSLLYPNLKLSQVSFHQDHCYPWTAFESRKIKALNLDADTVSDWQKKRNRLPNLQFLESRENEGKNKTSLIDWIAQGNDIKYRPEGVSLELMNFEAFYKARRRLIKDELMSLFDVPNNTSVTGGTYEKE
jgi:uncharacterized protein with ParB-like and HNH nuclease domain